LKRDEILEKLKKAEILSGSKVSSGSSKHLLEKIEKELKTDFIPELYDRAMEKMFDEKYYEAEDEEGEKVATAKDIDMKLMADEEISDEVEEVGNESESEDGSKASEEEGEPKIDPKQEQYERELSKSIKK
jgi:predicted S18 family serine protease